ncbi:MAG: C39 family peptidase [Chthonomonas sp.]|nr:C39 family peptidase [Chthonomonas sp.]
MLHPLMLVGATAPATAFQSFHVQSDAIVIEQRIKTTSPFDDVVLSLTARAKDQSLVRLEVRAIASGRATKFYSLGEWSEWEPLRRSIDSQGDADGTVYTDTLVLKQPATEFEIRITRQPGTNGELPIVEGFDVSFVNSKSRRPAGKPRISAWDRLIPVVKRNQGDYENGGVLCSPTTLSMLISYWSEEAFAPRWFKDVPEVQAGVYDQVWKGTGNWTFNAAYAASLGLRSYVTRLNNLSELEAWIEAGFPVGCSVSYGFLKGLGQREDNDGHLVALVGFTPSGDAIINDPGRRAQERHIIPRRDFDDAWNTSGRAVYLVYPHGSKVPRVRGAAWDQ